MGKPYPRRVSSVKSLGSPCKHGGVVLLPGWVFASSTADAVAALVGTAVAGALWLALAFRSVRLRDEGSPKYVGYYRWTGEQVRTRRRAVAFVVGWGLVILLVNVLILG
jgi:hypothetical protein